MITFEQARSIVAAEHRANWAEHPDWGHYMVAEWGWENDEFWLVRDGSREDLIEDNPAFFLCGGATLLVAKTTGKLIYEGEYLPGTPLGDLIDSMTLVGELPAHMADEDG